MTTNDYPEITIMYVRSDSGVRGSKSAFDKLEEKLPTLRGRKFYGLIFGTPPKDEYWACVELQKTDVPKEWDYHVGSIPKGLYAQEKIENWNDDIESIGKTFEKLSKNFDVDHSRPSVEFYRSMRDMRVRVPIRKPPQ